MERDRTLVWDDTAPLPSREPPALLGVVDVGSNTARLVVFEVSSAGVVRPVLEQKEVPRLGLGTHPDGSLASEAMERGIASLARFASQLRLAGAPPTLAVATSAVRDAPNGSEFLSRVQKATGISLKVLSGAEEARYAYLGVASAWELHDELVVDVGGGSMQVVEVHRGTLRNSVSLPFGVLRVNQRFLEHDPPKAREIEALHDAVRLAFQSTREAFGGERYRVFAVGGTVRALARATIDLREYPIPRVHGHVLRRHDLEAMFELLSPMPSAKRRAIPGIGGDRADVIVAGIVVFQELLRLASDGMIVVSGTGIREGLALEAAQVKLPASAETLAFRSARAAADALSFSLEHGSKVADTSAELFDLLAPRFDWTKSERLALRVAAWLHDSGTSIDLWRHARHSAYVVRNFPIWGLDQRETLLASLTTYLHEGDDPPPRWRKEFTPVLRPHDLEAAHRLGAILYVCELLAAAEPRFTLASGGDVLQVAFRRSAESVLPPRALDKVRKPLQREFDVTLKAREA